ncbi:MAG TPA: S24 family peptidase [Noviherbaspirillum sp.]|uniref:LexA family transcriptional regulator n=1 Tax=Noviherbaspirillum sp. TaxID=1926288 RepID=UPI002F95C6F4
MANRIEQALAQKNGGNQSEMARFVGVSPQAVQKWVAGDSEPRGANLKRAAEFLGVSEVFLKFGLQPMAEKTVVPQSIPGARRVIAVDDEEEHPDLVRVRKVKLRLSAGIAGFAVEDEIEDDNPISFRRNWLEKRGFTREQLIALPVKGQSMEPGLYDGDTVVVNTADRKPRDGEVFAVNYEGEAVIKRMVREIGFWWLVSDNPDQRRYPRKQCTGDMCQILGKVVHKQSEHI